MLSKPIPRWIIAGGMALAAIAGCINAIGFIGAHHLALTHLSGTVTNIGGEAALGEYALARHTALMVIFFFLGCTLSGLIIRHSTLRVGRRYGVALAVEAALLFAATYFLRHGANAGDYLATMAAGLQNAMATTYSGAVIRTTHVTGIVTDLGIALGLAARRERVDWRRMRLYLVLLGGFLGGSFAGALGYAHYGFDSLLVPATIAGVTGVGYATLKHYRRLQVRRRAPAPALALPESMAVPRASASQPVSTGS